jgi:cell division septum initiation protein DivIVA
MLLAILAQAWSPTGDPQAKAQAQALLGQGTKLYQQGDVADALEKFQAAYAAFPSPKLMFNIGQANRDLSRPVEALEAFEKFLVGAADASPEMIADARKSVAQLQKKLGRIQVDCESAGAEVSVDGKSVGLAPLPDLIWVTPGRHQVTAKHASAAPAIEDADVTAGSVSTVTVRLRLPASSLSASAPNAANFDVQATAPSSEAKEGWWLGRKWTWVAAGSTVLLAVGAITAGLLMDSKFDSLRSSCGAGNTARPGCSQSDIDSVSSRQTTANVFWGLAGAAAVTTGVLFYVEGRPVSAAPMVGGMTGATARVGF